MTGGSGVRGTSACAHCLESQMAALLQLTDYLTFSFPQSSPQPSAFLGRFQMNHSLVEVEDSDHQNEVCQTASDSPP